jgi:hypothetical protein
MRLGGWIGHYGLDQLFCECSTRRHRTGTAATAASQADYVDPLGLLTSTRVRLKPPHR